MFWQYLSKIKATEKTEKRINHEFRWAGLLITTPINASAHSSRGAPNWGKSYLPHFATHCWPITHLLDTMGRPIWACKEHRLSEPSGRSLTGFGNRLEGSQTLFYFYRFPLFYVFFSFICFLLFPFFASFSFFSFSSWIPFLIFFEKYNFFRFSKNDWFTKNSQEFQRCSCFENLFKISKNVQEIKKGRFFKNNLKIEKNGQKNIVVSKFWTEI